MTAIGINQVIGSGIFVLPASVAALSAVARLLFYITTCVSVLRFERRNSASIGFFKGVLLPVIGAVSSVTMIILAVDSLSLTAAGAAVLAGALIYGIQSGFSADPGED